jgi:hypothetical protein
MGALRYNLAGNRYGRLFVIGYAGAARWVCVCDCGNKNHVVRGDVLRAGLSNSCGCAVAEALRARSSKHGHSAGKKTAEYAAWRAMLDRCERPTTSNYHRYGGRGIKVCKSWHEFPNFLADMGRRPDRYSLDRINNDGDYEPSNCRWATISQQCNNKSQNVYIEANGKRQSMKEWARELGVPYMRIVSRAKRGWPPLQALGMEERCRQRQ